MPELHGGAIRNTQRSCRGAMAEVAEQAPETPHLYGDHEAAAFATRDQVTTIDGGDLGVVGLCICFDADFPESARAMRDDGARLVLCPCAYEVGAKAWWERLHPAAAMANGQWWVMPNQVGANAGVTFLGGSRVLSPFGDVVARWDVSAPGSPSRPSCRSRPYGWRGGGACRRRALAVVARAPTGDLRHDGHGDVWAGRLGVPTEKGGVG
ncbi:MAG: carbon-nitrogen hydrolase family protein [Actinomycetota bacterium]